MSRSGVPFLKESIFVALPLVGLVFAGFSLGEPQTTPVDFYTPGTQPGEIIEPMETAQICSFCHGNYDLTKEPARPWAASMMGQSARDPVFHAALAIANQDAPNSGVACLRCHAPMAHADGRTPQAIEELYDFDFEGVSCIICHRMVDPVYKPGVSPPEDFSILAGLIDPPVDPHNGSYVFDPFDRRRGPFIIPPEATYHAWLQSDFHKQSAMCATCHEVSNPVYSRQPDGSYALNAMNQPHPTQRAIDMFPEQRTYTEWLLSDFARGPIDMGGRFGGNNPLVSSCQDCHMPATSGTGCAPFLGAPVRHDLPQHHLSGANTWVLRAVDKLYPQGETGLTSESIDASIARNVAMLEAASDMQLALTNDGLRVRIINQTAHKLPTGYPEGRRMWLNVKFFDADGNLIAERGAYDLNTAILSTEDTKVYEAKLGLSPDVAALTGKPVGVGFHLVLNNVFYKDNRIPPRGFTNAAYQVAGIQSVGATYADGQYWDDTIFQIPAGASSATVALYYQTTSLEYAEFLRAANTTNNAGEIFWREYNRFGKSAPVQMDQATLSLCRADFNNDQFVDFFDFADFVDAFEAGLPSADFDGDGFVDFFDFSGFVEAFEQGC
jgi:hypothetical protein